MKKIIGLIFIIFLTGCASHQTLKAFKKDDLFEKSVLLTHKSDIINSLETKAILHATYLNPIDKSFSNNKFEHFIVGIYIVDDEKNENNSFLNNPNYKLTMNGQMPHSIKALSKDHKMYGKIPLYNNWAKYYEVDFEKTAKEYKLETQPLNQNLGNVKTTKDSKDFAKNLGNTQMVKDYKLELQLAHQNFGSAKIIFEAE